MTDPKTDLSGLSILAVDDDPSELISLKEGLKDFGAKVLTASTVEAASLILSNERIHVIIVALPLADRNCLDLVRKYKSENTDTLFYLLTEQNSCIVGPVEQSVQEILDDCLQNPPDLTRLAAIIGANFGRPRIPETSLAVMEPLSARTKPYFIFRSYPMRLALANLPAIASSDETVLISGETGTGKELVARAIHMLSARKGGPFVPINCGAIPESLIESELFGHEKGAFTGAGRSRKGKFESAHNGTLFLDEIGDMPIILQTRLLRVLEDKEVFRIGGDRRIPVNVRVIAATHMNLENAVAKGLFREDLFYRLNVLRIHLPPLRERVDDIPVLALHFLERAFDEMGREKPYPTFTPEAIRLLQDNPWKGNVRELRNIITRVATLLPADVRHVFPSHIVTSLGEPERAARGTAALQTGAEGVFIHKGTSLAAAEEILIQEALKQSGGNRTRAAKLLGISIRTLRRKLNAPDPDRS